MLELWLPHDDCVFASVFRGAAGEKCWLPQAHNLRPSPEGLARCFEMTRGPPPHTLSAMKKVLAARESGTPLRIVFVPADHYTSADLANVVPARVKTLLAQLGANHNFGPFIGRTEAWLTDGQQGLLSPFNGTDWADTKKLFNHVKQELPAFSQTNDVAVFLMKTPNNGNTRADQKPLRHIHMAGNSDNSFVHEFAHGAINLSDEYSPQHTPPAKPDLANIASSAAPGKTCNDKWGDQMGVPVHPHTAAPGMASWFSPGDVVGCHRIPGTVRVGGTTKPGNWDAPVRQMQCLMYQSGVPTWTMCPVCQRATERFFAQLGNRRRTITFDRFPDGHPITSPLPLAGNEFLAHGVKFAPDAFHYAPWLKVQPAVKPDTSIGNHLAMVEKGNTDQLVSRNIRMAFDWECEYVRVAFHGASANYVLEGFNDRSKSIGQTTFQATLGQGPETIELRDPSRSIASVEFGEDTAMTLITEITFG